MIYIPVIRNQVLSFVHTWNVHSIRRQPGRPHSVSGKPKILYYYSQKPNYGTPIDETYVDEMLKSVEEWGLYNQFVQSVTEIKANRGLDVDEYLPPVTYDWCRSKLADLGFERGRVSGTYFVQSAGMREHELAYRKLRSTVQEHVETNAAPQLEETRIPYGGRTWQPHIHPNVLDAYNAAANDPHGPEAREYAGDGPDPEAKDEDFEEEVGEVKDELVD